jgi:translation elongation factor EF-G
MVADEFLPIFERAIEPTIRPDVDRLFEALLKLSAADLQFRFTVCIETGQVVLAGIDETQLDQKIDTLRHTYDIAVRVGATQIAYCETITRRADIDYTHKKLSAHGKGEFARVTLSVDPPGPESGYVNLIKRADNELPAQFIPGIEKALEAGLRRGRLAGFPVIGVTITLTGGAYHDLDSSPAAFEIATRWAIREALGKSCSILLEPVMKVQVVTPVDCLQRVIDDFALRGGKIDSRDIRDGRAVIAATAPATILLEYTNALRSISENRATCTMQFDHYAPTLPPDDPPFRPAIGMRA